VKPRHLEILQHALGVDQYGRRPRNSHPDGRNHFCAGVADEPDCRELVDLGLMVQHATTKWLPYFNCSVTDAGRKAMLDASPAPPKVSAGRKRYLEYLDFADASECTFREWLDIRKTDWYRDMRGAA
jgi:hypothetical protein